MIKCYKSVALLVYYILPQKSSIFSFFKTFFELKLSIDKIILIKGVFDMFSVFIRTIIIYLILSILLKIMGKRQIGELEVSELVSTLLISEVAAIPITDPEIPLLRSLIPVLFIGSAEILISALKNKLPKLKKIVEGEPVYIIYKGKLKQRALTENRISINEILTEMRTQGIGNINDVYYGILEQNGKLSLLKREDKSTTAHAVIIDRVTDKKSLSDLGYDENWLNKQLRKNKVQAEDVFLMTVTDGGEVTVIEREEEK